MLSQQVKFSLKILITFLVLISTTLSIGLFSKASSTDYYTLFSFIVMMMTIGILLYNGFIIYLILICFITLKIILISIIISYLRDLYYITIPILILSIVTLIPLFIMLFS